MSTVCWAQYWVPGRVARRKQEGKNIINQQINKYGKAYSQILCTVPSTDVHRQIKFFFGGGPTPCVMRDLSFLTMDQTTIPAVAAWSLNHWAAREVLRHVFLYFFQIYLLFGCLGLHYSIWAFSSYPEQELLFVAVCGLLVKVVSLVAKHRLQASGLSVTAVCVGLVAAVHGLSCPPASGIFLDQGSNWCPLHCKVHS